MSGRQLRLAVLAALLVAAGAVLLVGQRPSSKSSEEPMRGTAGRLDREPAAGPPASEMTYGPRAGDVQVAPTGPLAAQVEAPAVSPTATPPEEPVGLAVAVEPDVSPTSVPPEATGSESTDTVPEEVSATSLPGDEQPGQAPVAVPERPVSSPTG